MTQIGSQWNLYLPQEFRQRFFQHLLSVVLVLEKHEREYDLLAVTQSKEPVGGYLSHERDMTACLCACDCSTGSVTTEKEQP